jgi:hypothetical protein
MLLADVYLVLHASFRSLFAMDTKEQVWPRQIRESLRLPLPFSSTLDP